MLRVAQLGAGAALAQEALAADSGGRVGRRLHHLERDFVAEAQAPRAVDLAHAAGAERHRRSRSDRR